MKTVFRLITALVIILQILLTVSCASGTDKKDARFTVAVSIVPQETFVKEVTGGSIDIVTAIPPGKSPETYAPSPIELEKLSRSSIYFSIGVPAEVGILDKLKDINGNIKIVDLAGKVKEHYPEIEIVPGHRDPHIWLSPKRAAVMVDIISQELSDIDKDNSEKYRENAQKYIEKLIDLDKKISRLLSNYRNRTFIVYHPSLGYFADDYGLNMVSIEEEGKEAAPLNLQKVIDIAREQNIKTVFYQSEMDSKQSRVFADEIGGKAVQVTPLAPDYIDNIKKIAAELVKSFE
ncbi:MAG: zinc ABC transporter solute-binding protein [Clostridiaceae bacterium]|nr:zinc ABC transporter solute-binding protein [Clostridiaceae bacterium]